MSQNTPAQMGQIRPLRAADIPGVWTIESQVYADPWSEDLLSQSLAAPMTHSLALFEEEKCVAYGIYQVVFTEGHLLNLAVSPERQREGRGEYLLELIMKDALSKGAFSFYLEVRPSNEGAITLYKKKGFRSMMRRERYYPNGEAAIVMLADLVPV